MSILLMTIGCGGGEGRGGGRGDDIRQLATFRYVVVASSSHLLRQALNDT